MSWMDIAQVVLPVGLGVILLVLIGLVLQHLIRGSDDHNPPPRD